MSTKVEIKYAYIDENLNIVDGNREFYSYFVKPGSEYNLDNITCPIHKNTILAAIKAKKKSKEYKILKFKKHQTEPKYNIVQVYDSYFNNVKTTCLKMIDLEQGMSFIRDYHLEDTELSYALSLTADCVFFYQQSTNVFKITQFYRNRRVIIYEQDIDEWQEVIIQRKIVPDNQIEEYKKFIADIKSCPKEINADLVCGFRTSNPNILESLSFTGVRFVDGDEIFIVGRIMPIEDVAKATAAKNIIEELQIDPLTKVYNKKTITAYAEKAFSEDRKDNIAFIIVDLDHFKPVNDAFGHLSGDRVLAKTGEILREIVGETGIVGRYGGDEFVLLISNIDNELILRGYLQTIMMKIREYFAGKFDDINITCSIGASVYPKDGTEYGELFKKADFCLYRAKDKGRNRYVFFRDDLHGELYKKAIEATAGIKYDDREIQELKYMSEFMQAVSISPNRAIKEILQHFLTTYNLDEINIYYGEDLKRIYCAGKKTDAGENALYANSEDFKKMLDGQYHFRVDFQENIKADAVDFKAEMEKRGIRSTVQCILGTPDNIKGLVAFNRTKEASLWAEYEVNCAVLFASSLNLLPESTKIDFAMYSKLKD